MERIIRNRVLPVLLISDDKLLKTVKFKKPIYIGDPVNAVKIFNDKEVDEIILLDISTSKDRKEPNYAKIEEICSEAFMPFAYGGGINSMDQIDQLFKLGIEKVILNSVLTTNIQLVKEASAKYGAQSIVGSIDVKKGLLGNYQAYTHSATKRVKAKFQKYLTTVLNSGIGELVINSIDKDGSYTDYDFNLIEMVSKQSEIPVVACGGAKSLSSFKQAIQAGASAVAAGSLFVYRGETKGILINYPSQDQLTKEVFS